MTGLGLGLWVTVGSTGVLTTKVVAGSSVEDGAAEDCMVVDCFIVDVNKEMLSGRKDSRTRSKKETVKQRDVKVKSDGMSRSELSPPMLLVLDWMLLVRGCRVGTTYLLCITRA